MQGWLIDAYRKENSIILWLKTPENTRVEWQYESKIYIDVEAEDQLRRQNINFRRVVRRTYERKKTVLELKVPRLEFYEKFVKDIENLTKYRIAMYNSDVPPEQMFLFEKGLMPFNVLHIEDNCIRSSREKESIPLTMIDVNVLSYGDIRNNPDTKIKWIEIDGERRKGKEKELLEFLLRKFRQKDPDVVKMKYAFSVVPYLAYKLASYGMEVPFHRWDKTDFRYKGGKSYYSYGQVGYQDFAIRLRGRLLLDTTTMMGSQDIESIIELCQLSGMRFQQATSRSFGATFQGALVRQMVERKYLVPYKQKPIERPMSMFELLKADRAGHTMDPKIGFHKNVAEIDFSSMYPWLIYNKNISAETIFSDREPKEKVPNVPITVSYAQKGLVPIAIKPFLDRRMEYKKNPTALNKKKAAGLKWVLVTSYGYLRFREFKLGLPSSHMAIGSYARDTLLLSARLAEEKGFEVVHGIVDSLYLKKKNINKEKVEEYCKELEMLTGIPVSFEGIFKWIVFLPSIQDDDRPVPTKYYGVFTNGEIKARGIEVRQTKPPLVVKKFQENCLERLSLCEYKKDLVEKIPELCRLLRNTVKQISKMPAEMLTLTIKISKTKYKHNIPQKQILESLKKKGITMMPGQQIPYVHAGRAILPEEYRGKPDVMQYKKLLVQSLYVLVQPFVTKEQIVNMTNKYYQTKLTQFHALVQVAYPVPHRYRTRKGLSEKMIRKKLEKKGYLVWRGAMIHTKEHEYPNVEKKYRLLADLLEEHRPGTLEQLRYMSRMSGMPDFFCYRDGEFKFVECKLGYECLSERQKKCIGKLQQMGFEVEVHRLVDKQTKDGIALVNLSIGTRNMIQEQKKITAF